MHVIWALERAFFTNAPSPVQPVGELCMHKDKECAYAVHSVGKRLELMQVELGLGKARVAIIV